MSFYTVIPTSKEQAEQLFNKHLKPILKTKGLMFKETTLIPNIVSSSFSYDSEDDIGFVTLYTLTGKRISYQLRGSEPMFVEFTGFGNIRYDIAYPNQLHPEMYKMLKEHGNKASDKFWKGGEI